MPLTINKALLVNYCRLISPFVGVGLGVYLMVIFANSYWLSIIGGAHFALAFFLFLLSILAFAFALVLLINACKPRFSLFKALYHAAVVLDLFFVLVVLYETSPKRQQEFDYWVETYLQSHNGTQLVTDFNNKYQDAKAQHSFVRERTVFAHDIVFILSCFWFIILAIFTIGVDKLEIISLFKFQPTLDENEDTTKLVDLEQVEVEEPPHETETEVAPTDRDEVQAEVQPSTDDRRVLFAETKASSATNSGTDEEYMSNVEETDLNSSRRSLARRSKAEIPSSLRRLHLEEPDDESDDFRNISLSYVSPPRKLPPVLPPKRPAGQAVPKKPPSKWQKMRMELQFSDSSSSSGDYSYSSFL